MLGCPPALYMTLTDCKRTHSTSIGPDTSYGGVRKDYQHKYRQLNVHLNRTFLNKNAQKRKLDPFFDNFKASFRELFSPHYFWTICNRLLSKSEKSGKGDKFYKEYTCSIMCFLQMKSYKYWPFILSLCQLPYIVMFQGILFFLLFLHIICSAYDKASPTNF